MELRRTLSAIGIVGLIALCLSSITFPVGAATAEPTTTDLAWYWEDSDSQSVDTPVGTITAQTPNPFCPTNPGSGVGDVAGGRTCAEELLPLWVRGADYETPYMMSAVAFDFTLVPIGSEVNEFTVTFLEDETSCEQSDAGEPKQCRTTDQLNAENQTVQACLATQIIGGGESRPIREVPNHDCAGAPTATRTEIKNDDEADPDDTDPDHIWKFDLTPYAQGWVENFSVSTGIVLRPIEAQKEADREDDWRVVFAGPRMDDGVKTKLDYDAPDDPVFPTDPTDPTDPTTPTSPSFPSSGFPDTGSPDSGGQIPGGVTPTPGAPTEVPGDGNEELAGEEASAVQSMPGYVWLGLLAGVAGFLLVRSIVMESVSGMRSDGVLAQIKNINAQRRGPLEAASTEPGALAALGHASGKFFKGVGHVVSKPFSRFKR
jgi:hypothetical protein